MNSDTAKSYLKGTITCAALHDDTVYTSEKTGIQPMMDWISEQVDLRGFHIADRIVGKAAAMLFVKAGIASVYAEVLSVPAKTYLESHGIPVTFQTLTQRIINRNGNGICPMEETVLHIEDAEEGYLALQQKLSELQPPKADI